MSRNVITIGNFDGVHLGHQQVFARTREQAAKLGARSVAYTFKPHPQHALNPDKAPPLLLTYAEKCELMSGFVDVVHEEPFSRDFSALSALDFFEKEILKKYSAKSVVVGHDFSFGKDRQGSQGVLKQLCKENGIELMIVEAFKLDGETVSSTLIRECLLKNWIEKANQLMGRVFFYQGRVMRGDRRGREIGFPTMNLDLPDNKLALPNGVYITQTKIASKLWQSVTNIGTRPTFYADHASPVLRPVIETHVMGFDGDQYGRPIEVLFRKKIRDEKKFSSREELHAQIQSDIQTAKKLPA